MTISATTLSPASGRTAWSLVALATVGLAASVLVIVAADGDPSHVRWPLVVAPLVLTLVPLVLPWREVRLGAAVLLGFWCAVAVFSIGVLLLPALAAALMAAGRDR